LSPSASFDAMMAQRLARVLWRRKFVCVAVAAIVVVAGSSWLLTRQKIYQSSSSVALLPVTTNSGVLPNYPNLISSLIPTYIQLVSSPVLLDAVRGDLPFAISETQLASDVYAESLSNAAVITIVAQNPDPVRAQIIAERTTAAFRRNLRGNRVVIPQIYAQPTLPTKPSSPNVKLVLGAVLAMAVVLGLGAGLIWERLSEADAGQVAELPFTARAAPKDTREPGLHDLSADERQLRTTTDPHGQLRE
jgi:capsular polysaccharide biosynthesis protein